MIINALRFRELDLPVGICLYDGSLSSSVGFCKIALMTELGMVLLSASVGALSAISISYLTKCLEAVSKRKLVATQVYAYLNYWYLILMRYDPLKKVFAMSEFLLKEKVEAAKKGEKSRWDRLVKSEFEWEDLIREIMAEDKELVVNFDEVVRKLHQLTELERAISLEELETFRVGLRQNEVFISDEQAAVLWAPAAQWVIQVRQGASSIALDLNMIVRYSATTGTCQRF